MKTIIRIKILCEKKRETDEPKQKISENQNKLNELILSLINYIYLYRIKPDSTRTIQSWALSFAVDILLRIG